MHALCLNLLNLTHEIIQDTFIHMVISIVLSTQFLLSYLLVAIHLIIEAELYLSAAYYLLSAILNVLSCDCFSRRQSQLAPYKLKCDRESLNGR